LSLKHNILANYVSQFYATLIGVVMVPVYVRYMGAEAYGLVGFFSMLYGWFYLLDLGLTPVMARETARFCGDATEALNLRRLLRTLEGIFIGLALCGALAIVAGAGMISTQWLKVQQLPLSEVRYSIMLMAGVIALRWICSLYRSAMTGFELMVWLSGFNIVMATLRFVLVIPFFICVGASPTDFFAYQLAVAVVEAVVLIKKTYRLLPKVTPVKRVLWEWQPLGGVLKFSLSFAFGNVLWVMIMQVDNLVLSKFLPLTDYAYFTLAALMASGIGMLSSPISVALVPRLTKLSAQGNEATLIALYRETTQLVCMLVIPASLILVFFPVQVLQTWTGNPEIAHKAAPVMALYAMGNCIQILGAFPYYLQYAKGRLKLHLIGTAISAAILIPALILTAARYGAIGSGYTRIVVYSLYFLFWVALAHRSLMKGLHARWLLSDVGITACATLAAALLIDRLWTWPQERLLLGLHIGIASTLLLAVAIASSSQMRQKIGRRYHALFMN
jgi:O-antigen/teichoic acid export membrane protein